MDTHAEPLGAYGAGAYHDHEYGHTEAYTNPYPPHEDGMDAWAIHSDDESEPESEEEDFDVYRDFNNMSTPAKEEPVYEHTAPQRDQNTLPSRRAQTESHPPPRRRTGPQLVSFHDMGGLYPATMSSQHVHDMQRGAYDTTRGHSFASDDAKPFAYDLGESTLELAPLGEEFTSEERARMTRKAQRRHWRYSKLGAVDSWMRGYNPLCGWFGPHVAVFTVFFFLVFLGVLLYFVVPRVPDVTLKTKDPLAAAGDTSAMDITAQPTGFEMNGTLTVRLDNGGGWIPSHLTSLSAEVHYKPAKTKVGSGSLKGKSVPGRKTTELTIPIQFNYHSLNSTGDDTQLAFQKACAHPCTYGLLTQIAACSGRVGDPTDPSARSHG